MSRAFVKEQDDVPEAFAERPVSPHPNIVTPRGLRLIDAEIDRLRKAHGEAQSAGEKSLMVRLSRDLRYWTQRRATAQVVTSAGTLDAVGFGSRVTIQRDDGRRQVFTIVGEDEADPAAGLIAYVAPVARALLGKGVGEFADTPIGELEILALEAVNAEG